MASVDWDRFDISELLEELRGSESGPEAERMIWSFEQTLQIARIDEGLLDYMLAAIVCFLARLHDCSPRTVLETFFRRSVSEEACRIR